MIYYCTLCKNKLDTFECDVKTIFQEAHICMHCFRPNNTSSAFYIWMAIDKDGINKIGRVEIYYNEYDIINDTVHDQFLIYYFGDKGLMDVNIGKSINHDDLFNIEFIKNIITYAQIYS